MPQTPGSSVKRAIVENPNEAAIEDRAVEGVVEAPTRIKPAAVSSSDRSRATETAQALLGTTLDHYELLDCIGIGGMGQVFRARDTRLDRLVAIKVLATDLSDDAEVRRRFEQEAKASARLDSIHFARVYFVGEDRGLHYIAMEFVEGENLRKLIERSGRLDYAFTLNIALQLARGLSHAVLKGVVHRDIKPSNIIVTPAGTAKLLDMGLARDFLHHSPTGSELTQAGVTLGTFDYISPEQARDPRTADIRSDIYSLGCTVYHALTGSPPFPEGTALQKLLLHQTGSAPRIRGVAPDVPESVAALVATMMAKDPRQRHQTPAELIHDLVAICRLLSVPLSEEPNAAETASAGPGFWERQLAWAMPTLVLLGAVGAYAYVNRATPIELSPSQPLVIAAAPPALNSSRPATSPAPVESAAKAAIKAEKNGKGQGQSISPGPATIDVALTTDLASTVAEAPSGTILKLQAGKHILSIDEATGFPAALSCRRDITLRGPENGLAELALEADVYGSVLSVGAGTRVRLERIRIVTRAAIDQNDADPIVAPVIVNEGGDLSLSQCALIAFGRDRLPAAIETEPSGDSQVALDACLLVGHAQAFRLQGAKDHLKVSNSAIAPKDRVLFCGDDVKRAEIDFDRVTIVSGGAAVFSFARSNQARWCRFVDSVAARILIAPVVPLVHLRAEPLRSEESGSSEPAWWTAERSLTYGFDFVRAGSEALAPGKSRSYGVDGSGITVSMSFPLEDAIPTREASMDSTTASNPVRGFRLTAAAAQNNPRINGEPIGVRSGPWGPVYGAAAAVAASASSEPRAPGNRTSTTAKSAPKIDPSALIVDPTAVPFENPRVLHSLQLACRQAQSGTKILLRTNQVISEPDIEISAKELTIEAYPEYQPKLDLGPPLPAADNSVRKLFRLLGNARLRVTEVELRASSGGVEGDPLSVLFECSEAATVELKDLWISAGKEGRGSQLAIVHIASPIRAMPEVGMPMPAGEVTRALLTVSNCGIRAKGNLLRTEPAALWAVDIRDSFLAFEGPMIAVDGASPTITGPETCRLDLYGSTLVLQDSLLSIKTVNSQALPPRQVTVGASQTVFLGIGGAELARSSGSHAPQDNAVQWDVGDGSGNFLAGFEVMYKYGGSAPDRMPISTTSLTPDAWLLRYGFTRSDFLFGRSDAGDYRGTSIWLVRAPKPDDLRRLGLDDEGAEFIGVSALDIPAEPTASGPR